MPGENQHNTSLLRELEYLRSRVAEMEQSTSGNIGVQTVLDEKEATINSIFRAAPTGIGLVSNRIIKKVNDRLCEMVGYSAEELLGQSARMLYPTQEEFDRVGDEKYRQIQARGTGTVETRWRRKDGSLINVLLSSTPLDASDLSLGVTFTALDITDRVKTEAALRASEDRYRMLVDSLAEGVSVAQDGILRYVNSRLEELTLYSHEELCSRPFIEFVHPDDRELVADYHNRRFGAEPVPNSYRLRTINKEGETRWFDISVALITWMGRPASLNLMNDITDQILANERLRASEERFRDLANLLPQPVFEIDLEGNFIYANQFSFQFTGYTESDLRNGFNMSRLFDQDDLQISRRNILMRLSGEAQNGHEYTIIRRDGTRCPVLIYSNPIIRNGEPIGLRGIMVDISERKLIEEERRASFERCRLQRRAITRLITDETVLQNDFVNAAQVICRAVAEALDVARVGVWRFEDEGSRIRCLNLYERGSQAHSSGETLQTSHYPNYFRALEASRAIDADDACNDPRTNEFADDYLRPLNLASLLDAPVRVGGEVVGILCIEHEGDCRHWQADEIAFAGEAADQIAQRLHNLELMESEKALRESEDKYRNVVERANDGIVIIQDSMLKYANKRIGEILGYAADELVDTSYTEYIHPDELSMVRDRYERRVAGETVPMIYETAMRHRDGRRVEIEMNAGLIQYHGEVANLVYVRDITERKRAQEELARTQALLYAAVEQSPAGVLIADAPDVRIRLANAAALGIRGANAEPLTDIPVEMHPARWQTFHPDGCPFKGEDLPLSRAILNGKTSKNVEVIIRRPDGEDRWVLANASPIRNSAGDIVAGVVVFADITDRRLAEEMLRESEERLELALKGGDLGLWDWNIQTGVVVFNDRWAGMLGYASGEVAQRIETWKRLVHPDDLPVVTNILKTHLKGRTSVYKSEYRMRAKDGEWKWILDMGKVVERAPDGSALRVSGTHMDITETKRLQELSERAKRLESAGRIAGQVAHDFNNLLGPLMAYPELIRDYLPDDSPALQLTEDMERAAAQIAEINQQLLTLGRRGHYNHQPINLNSIVEQVIKQTEPQPDGVIMDLQLDPDLLNVKGGASQLLRVISNLIVNATDAMQGVGRLTLKTESVSFKHTVGSYERIPRGEYVRLTVSDTGCGIARDDVATIFDPFFTTKKTDKKRGSGLGLSVVHAVMKDHNGYIDFESRPGRGTSFHLYLPITREDIKSDTSDDLVGGHEYILVIDDDDRQRDVSRLLLKKLGYRVALAESGEKALEMLAHDVPDLVVLDMVLPDGIDGPETYRRALEMVPGLKAIIVSGYAESKRVRQALDMGAGAFIQKPLRLESIAHAVRTELDRKPQDAAPDPEK